MLSSQKALVGSELGHDSAFGMQPIGAPPSPPEPSPPEPPSELPPAPPFSAGDEPSSSSPSQPNTNNETKRQATPARARRPRDALVMFSIARVLPPSPATRRV